MNLGSPCAYVNRTGVAVGLARAEHIRGRSQAKWMKVNKVYSSNHLFPRTLFPSTFYIHFNGTTMYFTCQLKSLVQFVRPTKKSSIGTRTTPVDSKRTHLSNFLLPSLMMFHCTQKLISFIVRGVLYKIIKNQRRN